MNCDYLHVVPTTTALDALFQIRALISDKETTATHHVLCLTKTNTTAPLQQWLGHQVELHCHYTKSPWIHSLKLLRHFRQFQSTVTVFWDPAQYPLSAFPLLTSKSTRCVSVMTLPSSQDLQFPTMLGQRILQHSHRVIVSSDTLLKKIGAGVSNHQDVIHIQPGFTIPDTLSESCHNLRDQLGLKPTVQLIGCVGEFKPQFRLKESIWMADILQKVKGDIHFVLFGDGSQFEILKRYRDQMWQRERIHFVSPWKMSAELLQQLNCMLTPADHDGQAIGMRIAQALGIPNVAARSDGNAELIHSGETGLLAGTDAGSLAKQIYFILNEPQSANQFGHQAALKYEHPLFLNQFNQALNP